MTSRLKRRKLNWSAPWSDWSILKEPRDPVGWYFDVEGNFELLLSLQCPTSRHHKGFAALINTHGCCCCCCEQINHEPQTVTSNRTLRKQKKDADPNTRRAPIWLLTPLLIIFTANAQDDITQRLCLKLDISVALPIKETGKEKKPFSFSAQFRCLQNIKTRHLPTIFRVFVLQCLFSTGDLEEVYWGNPDIRVGAHELQSDLSFAINLQLSHKLFTFKMSVFLFLELFSTYSIKN